MADTPTSTLSASQPRRWRFRRRWLLVIPLVIGVLLVAGLAWASAPWGEPMTETSVALESDGTITVERGAYLVFRPADDAPRAGLAYYPGAKVLVESYAPWAHELAEQGYLVALMPMPLNLAIFDTNAAAGVIDAYPDVTHWAVGGHSLGGVAAASYARAHTDVDGLVLMASQPADSDNLADRDDLAVAFIYASNDGLFTAEDVANARGLLPANTVYAEIVGGNHGQFGWYGPQSGDGQAEISRADQQAQIVSATAALLEQISGDGA